MHSANATRAARIQYPLPPSSSDIFCGLASVLGGVGAGSDLQPQGCPVHKLDPARIDHDSSGLAALDLFLEYGFEVAGAYDPRYGQPDLWQTGTQGQFSIKYIF